MKPDLYICHTAYQLMIALVRARRAGGGQSLLLTAGVPGGEALYARIRDTGVTGELIVIDESRWPAIVSGPFGAQRNRRAFEQRCGWRLERGRYRDIYICNDWSALGRYLQDCRAGYILCEDTLGSSIGPDQHLVYDQRAAPRQRYQYWGDSPCCRLIESEDAARCVLFPPERMTTFSKMALLNSLTEAEKAMLRGVFITAPLPRDTAGACLLLPRSFVLDGLMDQPTQDRMFRAVAEKYCTEPLLIKTHPRDETDYHALFPQAVVLERTMPSEILSFCLSFRFARAVTVQSFVLRSFTAADETLMLTLDEALALIG